MANILYISYDGMSDPLGESQVLSYQLKLAENHNISLISFEKKNKFESNSNRIYKLIDDKLKWYPLNYHKTPPIISTVFDLLKCYYLAKKIIKENNIEIIHCRGYISSIIGINLRSEKIKFIFDMRGWWADEKKESGTWNSTIYKPVYHFFKKLEYSFFKKADIIVSLTEVGKTEINSVYKIDSNKIRVIGTCVNIELFRFDPDQIKIKKNELHIDEKCKILVYSGSISASYPVECISNAFEAFKSIYSNSKLLILSNENPASLLALLVSKKTDISEVIVKQLEYQEVGNYLALGDYGIIFYSDGYSTIGRCPTKLGEYWSAGMPVLLKKNIGDAILYNKLYPGCISLLNNNSLEEYKTGFNNLKIANKELYLDAAKNQFDLNKGVAFYGKIYSELN